MALRSKENDLKRCVKPKQNANSKAAKQFAIRLLNLSSMVVTRNYFEEKKSSFSYTEVSSVTSSPISHSSRGLLRPITYTRSNINYGFTQSVSLMFSL